MKGWRKLLLTKTNSSCIQGIHNITPTEYRSTRIRYRVNLAKKFNGAKHQLKEENRKRSKTRTS